ncbi:LPXTG cell wall anchor domain-containing protein [Candidatus Enterococcus mansonii]|uniref:Gram-positive cocci surface proteins LPxTG domain-containing protein n=1 Tax=Candidatus Enterococcus mansonii TaxID=1834181 RepID=A0A242CDX9_9ENTE|nr:LPXTG cell wall anchor domain-containing protein [Enterococcus sp. 4G2_DIV0659]OTO08445.1 hypothetical protein A5880_001445 [Enterococcus sp. 4G2_DIV0659]
MKQKLSIFLFLLLLVGLLFNKSMISYGAEMASNVGLTFTDDVSIKEDTKFTGNGDVSIKKQTSKSANRKLPATGETIVFFFLCLGLLVLLIWATIISKKYKGAKHKW